MLKKEIISRIQDAVNELIHFCHNMDDSVFFYQPSEKWSLAQNILHLELTTNATTMAYRLPKFMLRIYSGVANRPSRSYEELTKRYDQKLAAGGRAGRAFIPKPPSPKQTKAGMLDQFSRSANRLLSFLDKKWKEQELDRHIVPHPLLGKITMRELAYFTIYHTRHHHRIMEERATTY